MCVEKAIGVMDKNIIDLFFLEISKKTNKDTEVIITGAAAGALFGYSRPSLDIDFEIRGRGKKDAAYLEYLDGVVREISARMGIDINYGEDISHWTMIDYLDYRHKTIPYKKIDQLDIRIMAPEYWTIGKMTRFLEIDTEDMTQVIRKKKLDANEMIGLWARALKASPMSLAKKDFIDHVRAFIKTYGKRAWGKDFDAKEAVMKFNRLIMI